MELTKRETDYVAGLTLDQQERLYMKLYNRHCDKYGCDAATLRITAPHALAFIQHLIKVLNLAYAA